MPTAEYNKCVTDHVKQNCRSYTDEAGCYHAAETYCNSKGGKKSKKAGRKSKRAGRKSRRRRTRRLR